MVKASTASPGKLSFPLGTLRVPGFPSHLTALSPPRPEADPSGAGPPEAVRLRRAWHAAAEGQT